jgi:hypothetical protein
LRARWFASGRLFFVTSLRVRFWGAQAASLQSSAACRRQKVDLNNRFSQKLVGQRPKRAGWQPALPRSARQSS